MTGVPVETVVELLMENYQEYGDYGHEFDFCIELPSGKAINAPTSAKLRGKVREYVETLVRTGEDECPENERQ
jgi:hypothetical protein